MVKKKGNKYFEGLLLIMLGLLFLGVQKEVVDWDQIWPFAVMIPGFIFYITYFKDRKNFGVLMPGTIIITYGLLFLFLIEYGWGNMDQLWPIFILGPGLGFFAMYFGSGRKSSFLIPGTILISLAFLFLVKAWEIFEYWPLAIILVGVYMLYSGYKNKKNDDGQDY